MREVHRCLGLARRIQGWQTQIVAEGDSPALLRVDTALAPLQAWLGVLGMPGRLLELAAEEDEMIERRLDPCMSEVFGWEQIPDAHVKMRKNEHKPGNMAVLVQSPKTGLRTFEEALAARG